MAGKTHLGLTATPMKGSRTFAGKVLSVVEELLLVSDRVSAITLSSNRDATQSFESARCPSITLNSDL